MSYRELLADTNEEVRERLELVVERIADIVTEQGASVPQMYREYFVDTAKLLLLEHEVCDRALTGELARMPEEAGEELNHRLFDDIRPEGYETGYANPAYAAARVGEEYGPLFSALSACIHDIVWRAFEGNRQYLCIYAELFVEIYNCFEAAEGTSAKELGDILYSFMHDYTELFSEDAIVRLIDPSYDFWMRLLLESDLAGTAYLYRYGFCIGRDEVQISRFLSGLEDAKIRTMADTYTEGYRKGFEVTGKDIRKKSVVEIRYPIGFERVVKRAVFNFRGMGMMAVLKPYTISENRQYTYDHREDGGLWMDKAYVERALEVTRGTWERMKEQAPKYGGPAVIEIFGREPFTPAVKPERVKFSERQQELSVYQKSESSRLCNRAIRGEERSFTIIAFPVPAIGESFEAIFEETLALNALDYEHYRDMQQKLIDLLDEARYVHILGANKNRTDLYVRIWELADPKTQTAFENCVADVNIPVGEVFTSPVLAGTRGTLHVTQVYLQELDYRNLELHFEDGMITDYGCTNFDSAEENRKYIEDNLLFHHKSLPMGEFAIGTNTMAYSMAKRYQIADKLPILIAEKTGPHFAVGDTCYTYDEDNETFNPDGKAIVARENEISRLRGEDPGKAYFNCHTDITIPYDELGLIEIIREDGTKQAILEDGRFVVQGTEALNEPLEKLDKHTKGGQGCQR